MRKSLCFMRPLLSHLAWLKNLLCYMIHYGTYRGAVVGLRGAVVGLRGAAVGVRGAAVGNIGIPTYVISRGAVVRQPLFQPYFTPFYLGGSSLGSKRSRFPHLKGVVPRGASRGHYSSQRPRSVLAPVLMVIG